MKTVRKDRVSNPPIAVVAEEAPLLNALAERRAGKMGDEYRGCPREKLRLFTIIEDFQ